MKASNKGEIKTEFQFSVNNRNANGAAKIGQNITFQKGKQRKIVVAKVFCMVKLYTVYAYQKQSHLL